MRAVLLSLALTGGAYGIGGYVAEPKVLSCESDLQLGGAADGGGESCGLSNIGVSKCEFTLVGATDATSALVGKKLEGLCFPQTFCVCCAQVGGGTGVVGEDSILIPECLEVVAE